MYKRGWRQRLAGGAQGIRALFQPLLKGWLLTSQRGKSLFLIVPVQY
jgi:hypothetical protein